ncbi:MAG: S8 family serine peptidase [Bacteroidota bacterium]
MHHYPNLTSRVLLLIFLSLLVSSTVLAQVEEVVEHKIWVKFKEAIPECQVSSGTVTTGKASLDALSQDCSVVGIRRIFAASIRFEKAHRHYGLHQWYEITFADTLSTPEKTLAELFCKNAWVTTAEPIPLRTHFASNSTDTLALLNDPRYGEQWHYNNTGQSGGTSGADIRLAAGRAISNGDSRVIVAVIDGGIDTGHEDLAAALWVNQSEKNGLEGVDDDGNGYVDDLYGYDFSADQGRIYADKHGTHVAGTIGAVSNNGVGVAGIAGGDGEQPGVRLMSCTVFGRSGQGGFPAAFVYAADNGAVIAQNSWGGGGESQALEDAIQYFNERAGFDNSESKFDQNIQIGPMAGGLVVFAAGNNKSNRARVAYPASLETVMAVASLDHNDKKSDFSNYGSWVDIAAPGSEVLSTFPGNSYGYLSGTSMACPHVSGVAALIVSHFQRAGFSPQHVRQILRTQADDINGANPSHQGELGIGRVNAYRALSIDTDEAPDEITDLTVAGITFHSISLSGTATGLDGKQGTAAYYEVYLSENSTEPDEIRQPTGVLPTLPSAAGTIDTVVVDDLKYSTTYYLSLRVVDLLGNRSRWSKVVRATTAGPPRLKIHRQELTATVEAGKIQSDTLVIDNRAGKSPLTYQLSVDNPEESANWFSIDTDPGSVATGSAKSIIFFWDARPLNASTLETKLRLTGNDPDQPITEIPVRLTVTGTPQLTLINNQIDFGETYRTFSKERGLTVRNQGTDTLRVNIEGFDKAVFTVEEKQAAIAPGERYIFSFTFSPESVGTQQVEVVLVSNDPQQAEATVRLEGDGVEPPPLLISRSEIQSEVEQDSIQAWQVRWQNTSFVDTLNWSVSNELPEWLVLSDSAGRLSPRGSGSFRFSLSAESQPLGNYNAEVRFQFFEDATAGLPVLMTVVEPNLPPVWSDSIITLSVSISDSQTQFNLNKLVDDPEDNPLEFYFHWEGTNTASAQVQDSLLLVRPYREGSSSGIIRAKDSDGNEAEVLLTINVLPENRSPQPVLDTLEVEIQLAGKQVELNLDSLFVDPDGDTLTYSFTRPSFSSDDVDILESRVANLRIQDRWLQGEANALGQQLAVIFAYDPQGDYSSLNLLVSVLPPNQPPQIEQGIGDQYLEEDQQWETDLSSVFSDPDGDTLQFRVKVADTTVARFQFDGDVLRIIALTQGTTQVQLYAQDQAEDSTTLSFLLTVDRVTAINLMSRATKLNVYPNPVTDWLTVSCDQLQSVRVYNAQGKICQRLLKSLTDEVQIPVVSLPNGVYTLVILTQRGETYRRSFIKE